MEGADCTEKEVEEQAVLLVDDQTGQVTVVQPNEDGSYWRKIVRNKMIRMKEKRRVQAAKAEAPPNGLYFVDGAHCDMAYEALADRILGFERAMEAREHAGPRL